MKGPNPSNHPAEYAPEERAHPRAAPARTQGRIEVSAPRTPPQPMVSGPMTVRRQVDPEADDRFLEGLQAIPQALTLRGALSDVLALVITRWGCQNGLALVDRIETRELGGTRVAVARTLSSLGSTESSELVELARDTVLAGVMGLLSARFTDVGLQEFTVRLDDEMEARFYFLGLVEALPTWAVTNISLAVRLMYAEVRLRRMDARVRMAEGRTRQSTGRVVDSNITAGPRSALRGLGIERNALVGELALDLSQPLMRSVADVMASHAEMRLELVSLQVLGAHRGAIQTLSALLASAGRACDQTVRVSQSIAAMAATDIEAVQVVDLTQPVTAALDLVEAMTPRQGVFQRALAPCDVSVHPGVFTLVLAHLARAHALSVAPGSAVRVETRSGNDRAVVLLRAERVESQPRGVSGTHGVVSEVTSVLTPSVVARLRELLGRWRAELEIEYTAARGLSVRVSLPTTPVG